jgi:hypothetical protein
MLEKLYQVTMTATAACVLIASVMFIYRLGPLVDRVQDSATKIEGHIGEAKQRFIGAMDRFEKRRLFEPQTSEGE